MVTDLVSFQCEKGSKKKVITMFLGWSLQYIVDTVAVYIIDVLVFENCYVFYTLNNFLFVSLGFF